MHFSDAPRLHNAAQRLGDEPEGPLPDDGYIAFRPPEAPAADTEASASASPKPASPTATPRSVSSVTPAPTVHPAFGGTAAPTPPPPPTMSLEPPAVHPAFGEGPAAAAVHPAFGGAATPRPSSAAADSSSTTATPPAAAPAVHPAFGGPALAPPSGVRATSAPEATPPPAPTSPPSSSPPNEVHPAFGGAAPSTPSSPMPLNPAPTSWAEKLHRAQSAAGGRAAFAISEQGLVVDAVGELSKEQSEHAGSLLLAALDLVERMKDSVAPKAAPMMCVRWGDGFLTLLRGKGAHGVSVAVLTSTLPSSSSLEALARVDAEERRTPA